MASALPHLPSSFHARPQPRQTPAQSRASSKPGPAELRRNLNRDSWVCWPHCGKRISDSEAQQPPLMNEQKKPAGFTLFPVPPTPPKRKYYLKGPQYENHNSGPPTFDLDWEADDNLPPLPPLPASDLVPAPLRFRKPPVTPPSPSSSHSSPYRNRKIGIMKRNTARNSVVKMPDNRYRQSGGRPSSIFMKRSDSKASRFRFRASNSAHKHKRSASNSEGFNHWLDIEGGLVDRKRLSVYLGNVLGSSFSIPGLDHMPTIRGETFTLDHMHPTNHAFGPLSLNPPDSCYRTRPCTATKCQCSSDRVLCQGKSSPEFAVFNRWPVFRKSHLSVSSTACRVHVPRGQFEQESSDLIPVETEEDLVPSSPPGLIPDITNNGEDLDWSVLMSSPRQDDVFTSPPQKVGTARSFIRNAVGSKNMKRIFSAPASTHGSVTRKSPKAEASALELPSPVSPCSSSPSSFEFDFDYDSQRHFQRAPSVEPRRAQNQAVHRYFRNAQFVTPNTRRSEQPAPVELPTPINVASVARCVSLRPTLVSHRKSSAPPVLHEEDVIHELDGGMVEYSTRVQITRPNQQIFNPKRRPNRESFVTVAREVSGEPSRARPMVRYYERPSSRVTSDGSPVLGRTGGLYYQPGEFRVTR